MIKIPAKLGSGQLQSNKDHSNGKRIKILGALCEYQYLRKLASDIENHIRPITYASMMLSAGEPLTWLLSQMGHSNMLTTAKVYAKFTPGSIPDAGDKAIKVFGRVGKGSI